MVTLQRALGLTVRRVIPVSPALRADRITLGAFHRLLLTFSPMGPRLLRRISNCTSVRVVLAWQGTSRPARASRRRSPAVSLLRAFQSRRPSFWALLVS